MGQSKSIMNWIEYKSVTFSKFQDSDRRTIKSIKLKVPFIKIKIYTFRAVFMQNTNHGLVPISQYQFRYHFNSLDLLNTTIYANHDQNIQNHYNLAPAEPKLGVNCQLLSGKKFARVWVGFLKKTMLDQASVMSASDFYRRWFDWDWFHYNLPPWWRCSLVFSWQL